MTENISLAEYLLFRAIFSRGFGGGAQERGAAAPVPQHQDGGRRDRSRHAVGRQPAEGRARQMAVDEAQGDDLRRADARHRRRLEVRNLFADARAGRRRRGDPDDFLRHGGGDRGQRPHRGDAGRRDQRNAEPRPVQRGERDAARRRLTDRSRVRRDAEERSRPFPAHRRRRRGGGVPQPALHLADQSGEHRQSRRAVRPVLHRRRLRHHHRRHRPFDRLGVRPVRRRLRRPARELSRCRGSSPCSSSSVSA